MNRMKNLKKKIVENGPEIVYGSLCVGVFALYGYVIVASAKQQKMINQEHEKNQQMMRDAVQAGKTVLPNTDGSFWIIDNK